LKKNLHKNRAGGVAQGVGPEFKPQYCKKQTNKKTLNFLISGIRITLKASYEIFLNFLNGTIRSLSLKISHNMYFQFFAK
jgi:hypothetical protein